MLRRFSVVLPAVFVACASACSTERAPEETRSASDAIVNGTDSGPDDDQVVLLLTHIPAKDTAQGQYYENCTGTLLSPSIVLTARHCVSATSDGTFTCNEDGTLGSGPGGTIQADLVPSDTHVWVGPKLPDTIDPTKFPGQAAAYVHDAGKVTCNDDLALVVLAQPIPNAKISAVRLDGPVEKGEMLTMIGWGATVTSFIPPARQRRDGVSIVDIGPSPTLRLGGQLAAKEFLASESVCTGDSGGPAIDAMTGAVVGTVSRGPNGGITQNGSGCVGTQHTFMQTSAFKDLVMQAFSMTGESPWIEGQPQPGTGGAGGMSGSTTSSTGSGAKKPHTVTTSGCSIAEPGTSGASVWWLPTLALIFLRLPSRGRTARRR